MIRVTDDLGLDEREIEERFVRAMGSGGQNVRKEATAVELRFDIGSSSLPQDVKDRLMALAGRAVTTDGVLVVVSRVHRSQTDNREAVRARLTTLLQRAARLPATRRQTRPRRAEREKRLASKRLRGAVKRSRRGSARCED